jgi:cytochrome c553
MNRPLRWFRNALLGLVAIVILALCVVYARSEWIIRRTYSEPARDVTVPTGQVAIAEGMRLARIRGCTGCHGQNLEGKLFIDDALVATVASPDLTRSVREYSDAELERIIRHGIRPDGRSVVVMPSGMFTPLSDEDLGKILAYLRSVPAANGQQRKVKLGPLARVMFTAGKFKPAAVEAREAVAASASFPGPDAPTADGAYLARTVCTECHGMRLEGQGTPDLRIAAGYTLDQFTHLMRTGKATGNRELRLMSEVARSRFSNFTDAEIRALHAYLVTRAASQ